VNNVVLVTDIYVSTAFYPSNSHFAKELQAGTANAATIQ
jgi:hypothetical protein